MLQGSGGVIVASLIHDGYWNAVDPGYGTVMKINFDEAKEVVSYDVLMDAAENVATVLAEEVEQDFQYARECARGGNGGVGKDRSPKKGGSRKKETESKKGSNMTSDNERSSSGSRQRQQLVRRRPED